MIIGAIQQLARQQSEPPVWEKPQVQTGAKKKLPSGEHQGTPGDTNRLTLRPEE